MVTRTLKLGLLYALEALAALLALAIFAAAAVLWRLSDGPVALDFMGPQAERALAAAFAAEQVSFGSLEARFDPETALLFISAREVRVAGPDGVQLARIPALEAGLAIDSLLLGRIEPVEILIRGGSVSIVRRADGAAGAGLGAPEQVMARARSGSDRGGDVEALFILLRDPGGAGSRLGRLRRVSISEAGVRVVDDMAGGAWLLSGADINLSRDAGGLAASLSGDLATPAGFTPVEARIEAGADLESLLLRLRFSGLWPRAVAPASGRLAFLGALDAPVDADLFISASRDEGLRAASMTIEAGAGRLHAGGADREFTGAALTAIYDPEEGEIAFVDGRIESGALFTGFEGRIHEMRRFEDALPREWRYDLRLEDGGLNAEGFFEIPPRWTLVEAEGAVSTDALQITFDRLAADIGDVAVELSGEAQLREAGGRLLPDLRLSGPIRGNLTTQIVIGHWPMPLGDGARSWVASNVLGGRLRDARLEMDISADSLAAGQLQDEELSLSFGFDQASFLYVSTMPPVENASGEAELLGNAFRLIMREGRIGDIALTAGLVDIPQLAPRGAPARFGVRGRGQAADILALIDEEPLRLPSLYGIEPRSIGGAGEIRFEMTRPMLSEVPVEDLRFSVDGAFSGVGADGLVPGFELSGGRIAVTADERRLRIEGTARVGATPADIEWVETFNTPEDEPSTRLGLSAVLDARMMDELGVPLRRFIDGDVQVNVSTEGRAMRLSAMEIAADFTTAALEAPGGVWRKPEGEPGAVLVSLDFTPDGAMTLNSLRADAEGLAVELSARLGEDGRLIEAAAERFEIDGYANLAMRAARADDGEGALHISLSGAYLDAREFIASLRDFESGEPLPPLVLEADLARVRSAESAYYGETRLHIETGETGLEMLSLSARGETGPLTLEIAPGTDGRRRITARAPDFGRVMSAFVTEGYIAGGTLSLEGDMPPPGESGDIVLRGAARDFTVVGMPVLARILAAGSLEGLGALLSGQGIGFETLEAELRFRPGLLQIENGRAAGPAMGVTASGTVDLNARSLAFDGTLAPSYGLNSLFGGLSLVGGLLVSRAGEGVIGVTFSVEGPYENLTVFANPLSALAPGILRRIFEGTAAARAARERAERERAAQPPQEMTPEPDSDLVEPSEGLVFPDDPIIELESPPDAGEAQEDAG